SYQRADQDIEKATCPLLLPATTEKSQIYKETFIKGCCASAVWAVQTLATVFEALGWFSDLQWRVTGQQTTRQHHQIHSGTYHVWWMIVVQAGEQTCNERRTGEAPRQSYWARVHVKLHTPLTGIRTTYVPLSLRWPITSSMQYVDQRGSKRLALNSSGHLRESGMGYSLHINSTGVHGRLQRKGEPRIILEGSTV
ncbi:unnamed protein product, partial [Fusarium graminearum]